MIPFHSLFPELAQREVRCVHIGPVTERTPVPSLLADEYLYLEHYCEDLDCDCRRVFLQVIAKEQPGKTFASINYGWEKPSFYAQRMRWDPDAAAEVTRGELDPINTQSEFAAEFLHLFHHVVLDERYRIRLRRHYRQFKEELARRNGPSGLADGGRKGTGND